MRTHQEAYILKRRAYVVTRGMYDGCQRQLAWFERGPKDLYFEVFAFFMGSHTSYHRDGRIWRTSPATRGRPDYRRRYLPLDSFRGLHQLGISMVRKSELRKNPCLKPRTRRKALTLQEIDLEDYPSEILNIVVELLEPGRQEFIASKDIAPPPDATMTIIDAIEPWLVLTILGHEHNLLIEPKGSTIIVHHFNARYSANHPGVEYKFEAYGEG